MAKSQFNEAAGVQQASDVDSDGVHTPKVMLAGPGVGSETETLLIVVNRKLDFLLAALTGADPGDFYS